ncbi:MAG: biotin biosynthesis protein [Firmicutes bacterium HGW-Firmicutes-1]|jgi:pimeloyl-[acyl-carrier protein] methyl ester esterase|nr:MAG: biotin biosynthesis protein [Firmicutes bacterium HGW-Firmicutes-1]
MNKPYLVMLPGWGMGSYIWKPVQEMLSADFELLFVEWNDITSVDGYKEKVVQLMNQYKMDSFSLLGWSLGALVALELASQYTSQIKYVFLISGTSRFTIYKEEQYLIGWNKKIIERMKFKLEKDQQETRLNFNKAMFSNTENSNGQAQSFFEMVELNNSDYSTNSLLIGLDYLIQADVRKRINHIIAPMLLLHGEEDQICPLAAIEYIRSKKTYQTRLISLAHTGHIPFFTNPKQCYDSIKEFVKACEEGSLYD